MLCSNPFVKEEIYNAVTYKNTFGCGQCLNCRINQSRVWKNRILLEAKCSKKSYFVTLTYNDESVPRDCDGQLILDKKHLTNYFKRLRKSHEPSKFRYYAVGEYGDTNWRPHFHLAIFTDNDIACNSFDEKWPYGFTYIGDISSGSASYIAGYLQKKATSSYYENLGSRPPEYSTMSKQNGGIGIGTIKKIAEVLNKYGSSAPEIVDYVTLGKSKLPIGRYLTKKLSISLGVDEKQFKQRNLDQLHENDQLFDMNSNDYISNMLDYYKGTRDSNKARSILKKSKRKL